MTSINVHFSDNTVKEIKTKKLAKSIIVSLSKPAKMPCPSYGLPALAACPVGEKLAKVENSTCSDCYACKGQYAFSNVQECQHKRLAATKKNEFVQAMVKMIKGLAYFRWHDSGDVYSYEYLLKIISICEQTPDTKHWLPTREKGLFTRYVKNGGKIPDNMVIRISSPMIDQYKPVKGFLTSTVHDQQAAQGFKCTAPENDGFCLDCRACWDKKINNVSYSRH